MPGDALNLRPSRRAVQAHRCHRADAKESRLGAGPKFFALYERDGEPEGYTIYRVKDEWEQGDAARSDEPDLELDVGDLASVYLGAFDFHALARSERVRELRPGCLERASALFRTERPPFCPEVF